MYFSWTCCLLYFQYPKEQGCFTPFPVSSFHPPCIAFLLHQAPCLYQLMPGKYLANTVGKCDWHKGPQGRLALRPNGPSIEVPAYLFIQGLLEEYRVKIARGILSIFFSSNLSNCKCFFCLVFAYHYLSQMIGTFPIIVTET